MAAADSSSNISMGNNNDDIETNAKPNPNPDPDSFSKALVSIPSGSPIVCLQQFAGDSLAGAFMGSIFGFGAGLIKRKGFKPSIGEAASHAKTFAVLSGVHSLVVCFLKRLRRKDDVFNSGVAGCCTGLALSFPGEPTALLQSCLTFGAFSYVMDMLNKQQPAMAHSLSVQDRSRLFKAPTPSLALTLSLPLPAELKGAFSSFCESLRKPNDNNGCSAC